MAHSTRAWEIAVNLTRPLAPSEALVELCGKLERQAEKLSIAAIEECNGDDPLRRMDYAAWESKWHKVKEGTKMKCGETLESIAALPEMRGVELTLKFDGDPRGWVVRLIKPDRREVGVA